MRNPSSSSSAAAKGRPTPCCSKVGIKRGPWTPEEDEILTNYIKREGEGRWRTLPKKAGLTRCGKSCRLRWMNYLRPSVKRGRIDPYEEDLILRLHRLLGNRWSLIAGRIPGRTDNEIKNFWNTHLSKKLISQGLDPRTHKPLKSYNPNASQSQSPNPNQSSSNIRETIGRTNQAKPTTKTELFIPSVQNIHDNNENWGKFDGFMMDSQGGGHQGQRNNGEEEDNLNWNYCIDEDITFSSFVESLMNDNVFVSDHHHHQHQHHHHHHQQQQETTMVAFTSFDPTLNSSSQAFHVHGDGTNWAEQVLSSTGAEGSNILNNHRHL